MYYYIVTAEGDFLGAYASSFERDRKIDSLDIPAEPFDSEYESLSHAKQEYREKHPEFMRKNFKGKGAR